MATSSTMLLEICMLRDVCQAMIILERTLLNPFLILTFLVF